MQSAYRDKRPAQRKIYPSTSCHWIDFNTLSRLTPFTTASIGLTIPCRQSVDINFETEPLRSTAKPSGRSIKYSKIALNCQDVPAGWIRMPWCVFDLLDPRHIVWRKRLRLCWNPDRIVRWCGKIQLCRRAGCIYHWRFWLAYLLVLAEQKATQKRKARR